MLTIITVITFLSMIIILMYLFVTQRKRDIPIIENFQNRRDYETDDDAGDDDNDDNENDNDYKNDDNNTSDNDNDERAVGGVDSLLHVRLGSVNKMADVCIAGPDIKQSTFQYVKLQDKTVYTNLSDIIFDDSNMDPYKDVLHILDDNRHLLTIVIINTTNLYTDMFLTINDTLDRLRHLYDVNFIIVINEHLDIFTTIGTFNEADDSSDVFINWSKSAGRVRFEKQGREYPRRELVRAVRIIADENVFGFRDDHANVLFLHNKTEDKYNIWKKIKALVFT